MSIYGSIGFTRRDRYKDRILTKKEKETLSKLELELKQLQNKSDLLYEDLSITDEELKQLEEPIQNNIDNLINQINDIKYIKVR